MDKYDCKFHYKSDDGIVTMGFRGSSGALAVGLGALACEVVEKTEMTGEELLNVMDVMLKQKPMSQRDGCVTMELTDVI